MNIYIHAQLVRALPSKRMVVGSSPTRGSYLKNNCLWRVVLRCLAFLNHLMDDYVVYVCTCMLHVTSCVYCLVCWGEVSRFLSFFYHFLASLSSTYFFMYEHVHVHV